LDAKPIGSTPHLQSKSLNPSYAHGGQAARRLLHG
jgi:hypothetical protein